MKDSSLVRAAEAVRDGKASAMVSAGNTGATMASALLRMGRIKGVARPAIATPIPAPGHDTRRSCSTPAPTPSASPSGWCSSPRWAPCSPAAATASSTPRVGAALDRRGAHQGQPAGQGDPRAAGRAGAWSSAAGATFVGNVEGRDLMTDDADVVVTDGFTGNVALKTLEGGLQAARRRPSRGVRHRPTRPRRPPTCCCRRCSRSTPAARPRQHRRGDAPRRRRGLHHQPRLVVGHAPWSTPSRWRPRWSTVDLVGDLTAAIRPPRMI